MTQERETQPNRPFFDFETAPGTGAGTAPEVAPDEPAPRSSYSRINGITGWLLVALLLLAPIPVGSNRPVFWLGWAALIALLGLVQVAAQARLAPGRRARARDHLPLFALIGAVAFWGGIQSLPGLGALAGALPVPEALRPATISVAPGASLLAALRLLSYLVFFALALEVASRPDRAERMAWAVFFGIFVHALYGLAALTVLGDSAFWGEKTAYEGFATGTFVNRNAFASFVGLGMVLGLGLTLRRLRRKRIRDSYGRHRQALMGADFLGLAVMLALMAIALVSTGSRAGTFATLLALVVVFVTMELKSGLGWRSTLLRLGGVAGVLLVVMLPVYGLDLLWRFVFTSQNSESRTAVYEGILALLAARPFTGYGLDAFEPAYELAYGPDVQTAVIWEYAHSSYLGNWMDLGLIVGSLPLVAAVLAAVRIVGHLRRRQSGIALPAVALGALCLLAVHGTVDFSFETQANLFLLIFLLALGLASRNAAGAKPRVGQEDP